MAVDKEKRRKRERARVAKWRKDNPEKANKLYRDYRARLKKEVIEAYGGKCSCCGESHIAFLTIDHVDGGGTKHRKKLGHPNKLYKAIRDAGFPPEYQVLCWNCNSAKHLLGECPHATERAAVAAG